MAVVASTDMLAGQRLHAINEETGIVLHRRGQLIADSSGSRRNRLRVDNARSLGRVAVAEAEMAVVAVVVAAAAAG